MNWLNKMFLKLPFKLQIFLIVGAPVIVGAILALIIGKLIMMI